MIFEAYDFTLYDILIITSFVHTQISFTILGSVSNCIVGHNNLISNLFGDCVFGGLTKFHRATVNTDL